MCQTMARCYANSQFLKENIFQVPLHSPRCLVRQCERQESLAWEQGQESQGHTSLNSPFVHKRHTHGPMSDWLYRKGS